MWKRFLKFIPGIVVGIVVAAFYTQSTSAQGIILAFLFSLLVCLIVVLATEINNLEKKTDRLAEIIGDLTGAVASDIDNLTQEINSEFHEVYVAIANNRFGEDNQEED